MRLPIQSMQSVRLRARQPESAPWYRSVIVDFEEGQELVLILPTKKDLEKPASEEEEAGEAAAEETAQVEPEAQPPRPAGDDDELEPEIFNKGTGIEVEISFPDGIRRFTSVVRRLDLNYGGAMRVDWPTEGTRIQRRDYVRVDVSFRTIVWYRGEDEKLIQLNGYTTDFSAGGVRLRLEQPLPDEQRIEMEIQKTKLSEQTLQGRVVRSGELEKKRNEPQYYWVAVEFVGVDEGLRKEMTQMVFDIQREQMRKSLS